MRICFFAILVWINANFLEQNTPTLIDFDQIDFQNFKKVGNHPKMPKTFTIPISSNMTLEEPQLLAYDETQSASFTRSAHVANGMSGSPVIISDQLLNKDLTTFVMGDQCRFMNYTFQPQYSWLAFAKFEGRNTKYSRDCDLWAFNYSAGYLELCVNVDEQNNVIDMVEYSYIFAGVTFGQATIEYGTPMKIGEVPENIFDIPSICTIPPRVCKGGAKEEIIMYRFHPQQYYSPVDHNLGDAPGDTQFVCEQAVSKFIPDNSTVISKFRLNVWTAWGQYGLCNGYPVSSCIGRETFFVGREATMGLGQYNDDYDSDNCGQCSDNASIGTWFSLPSGGQCGNDETVDGNTCSWKLLERVKTINASCLFAHDFVTSCTQEIHPWPKSSQLFEQAFLTDDFASGGCPPIQPDN